ncbi:fumarylacetoacetate hydrolase family protein [Gottfriedia acidiceleris]|uniref:fumarylacetoacetate hydrolase family protein n=1 Tax=Bacillaceae TaxID=186817 RepID=UPI000BEC1C5D|nr:MULTISPECIES: fumarylacetoacetate hydrolase family protein [unclassified Bacillus (in: firmicutes)]PEC50130.1 2-keto-4-pentenoate hydratase [Bacillus sp. AFS096315]PFM79197.1 2-keto-4-pentenoate hydratase [Bacillus sp. AFS077874]
MGVKVIRYSENNEVKWGVVQRDRVAPIQGTFDSLSEFLKDGAPLARQVIKTSIDTVSLKGLAILSPVTEPARIVCQGANYRSHRQESGLDGNRPPYNLIFTKADSSLTGAYDDIICPSHVQLLDYEIELGLVIGAEIKEPVEVTEQNIHQYVAGLVIVNDVSARDTQIMEMQWYKGKSYRTFCPVGPYLYLLDEGETSLLEQLSLNLWVNGELRQSADTSQLLYKPAETLTELASLMNLSSGDLILTGTTGGVALKLNGEILQKITNHALSHQEKVHFFVESQQGNGYLKNSDIVRCEIKSLDGSIDLGLQQNRVVVPTVVETSVK